MANITKRVDSARNQLGSTPWGNLAALRYVVQTDATGAVIGSNSTAAVAIGDVIRAGTLPAGFRFIDSEVIVSTAMTALVTGDVGFAYTDGVDDDDVAQDATYFGAALALNAAARLRNATTKATVALPKDAWLTIKTAGAANAKASTIEIVVYGIAEGVK